MDEGEINAHAVSNRCCALRAACVGGNDHGILVVGDVLLDVPLEERPSVQVVDRHVKESLHCFKKSIPSPT